MKTKFVKLISIFFLFILMNASCIVKANKGIFKFNNSHKQKLENFVLLLSVLDLEIETLPESTASGFVFKSDNEKISIITANHFCNPSHYGMEDLTIVSEGAITRNITAFNKNLQRPLVIKYYDKNNDICVLEGESFANDNFFKVRFANNMPKIGDKIYNVAAPQGIASPDVVLLFDGYFGGCNDTFNGCIFTIPATSGSSGSAVYNSKGEVISIIVSSLVSFDNIAMGPHVLMLKGTTEYENLYR